MRKSARLAVAAISAAATLSGFGVSAAQAAFPGANGYILVGVQTPPAVPRTDLVPLEGPASGLAVSKGQLTGMDVSADGTRITGRRSTPAPSGLYVAPITGAEEQRVAPDPGFAPRFLPDGRVMYLQGQKLRVVALDGLTTSEWPNVTLPNGVGQFVVAPDGKAVYVAVPGWANGNIDAIRRIDLTTGASTTILSRPAKFQDPPTAIPLDVSPDGGRLLLSIETDATLTGGDSLAPAALFQISTTGAPNQAPQPVATQGGTRPTGRYSPDGTLIVYATTNRRFAAGEPPGPLAIRVVGVDGAGDRAVFSYPGNDTGLVNLAWQPGPPLLVTLGGGVLTGDLVEIDLAAKNVGNAPFSNLRYDDSGHAPGVVFNTALYSPEFRAAFSVLGGPTPSLLSALAPGQTTEHQYLVGIDSPGNVQVRSKWYATSDRTGEIQIEKTTYVVARSRDLPPGEEAMLVAGGWAELQAVIDEEIDGAFSSATGAVKSALPKGLSPLERAAARIISPGERGLARQSGLPDDALSWLPDDPETALRAYMAFGAGQERGMQNVLRRKLGSAYSFAVKTPWDFWSNQFKEGSTAVPVGTALYDEGAYWSGRAQGKARGFMNDAYALATDPKRQHQFKQAVAQGAADIKAKLDKIAKVAPGKARQLARDFAKDPVKGAGQIGEVYGTIRGEASFAAAEVAFTPNKGAIARGVKNVGGRLVKFGEDVAEMGRGLKAARVVAKTDDALPTAAKLGMPLGDQQRWQGVVRQVEAKLAKHGYNEKIELSFRPRNPHSAALGDAGSGKNMFMKGKSGTDIDLLLGMDKSGLGKLVIYKPKLPPGFDKLPPSMRRKLADRVADIEKARKEWLDPKSNLGRARTGKGVELTADLTNQKTGAKISTVKIKMRIAGYEKNGTISIKYLEHVVDGKVIVKPGKPKWVVSDYDGNAILSLGGKDLPGGAVRGLIEGEVMRLQRENGVAMATSFHGFTYNGMDLPGKYYRNNFHFLLEGMSQAQAKEALNLYLRKYATSQADFDALVESYAFGDYTIRVTSDAAFGNQGL